MVFTKSSKRLSAVANDGPPAKRQDLVPSPTKLGGASASSRLTGDKALIQRLEGQVLAARSETADTHRVLAANELL